MSNNISNSNSLGFLSLLGLLFIGLKLGGVIDWSWWLVTAPLWGAEAALIGILLVISVIVIIKLIYEHFKG